MTAEKRGPGRPLETTDEQVVEAYWTAFNTQPHRLTSTVAQALGISRATAGRRIARAMSAGLIAHSTHRPRHVRWATRLATESWLACAECRELWPCPHQREQIRDEAVRDAIEAGTWNRASQRVKS
jgi:hypothetical protein